MLEFLLILLVLAAAVLLITGPLRRVGAVEERESAERDRLAAAREAKYREIRELELDYRTGKLSREDYRAQDAARRAEAVEILRALDELEPQRQPARSEPEGLEAAGAPSEPPVRAARAEARAPSEPPLPAAHDEARAPSEASA